MMKKMMKKKGYAKGGMKKKGYAKGGMMKKGMAKGGATKMTLAKLRAAAKKMGYKLVKIKYIMKNNINMLIFIILLDKIKRISINYKKIFFFF